MGFKTFLIFVFAITALVALVEIFLKKSHNIENIRGLDCYSIYEIRVLKKISIIWITYNFIILILSINFFKAHFVIITIVDLYMIGSIYSNLFAIRARKVKFIEDKEDEEFFAKKRADNRLEEFDRQIKKTMADLEQQRRFQSIRGSSSSNTSENVHSLTAVPTSTTNVTPSKIDSNSSADKKVINYNNEKLKDKEAIDIVARVQENHVKEKTQCPGRTKNAALIR